MHAVRRTRPIESVVFARSHRRSRGHRGWSEVTFLELTTQLFRELDLGIAREPRFRFDAGIVVGQLNLEHGGDHYAYRMPERKCPVKTGHAPSILRIERPTESAPCQNSRQRGTEAAVHDNGGSCAKPAVRAHALRWEILLLEDYDAVIQEGQARNGMSALIDLVARKA